MSVRARLEEVFQNIFNDDGIALRDDMTAADIPAWDSVAHVNLMFSIESAFGVQFPGTTFGDFKSIGELITYLEKHAA